jgi:endonuclease G
MSRQRPIYLVMKALTALLLFPIAALAADPPFGSPACSAPDLEPADRRYFFLCHNPARKVAVWVGYTLSPSQLDGMASRPSRFRPDYELSGPAASDRDYRLSGFSRGHLAPAADFAFSEDAIRATFVLSNAVPQRQSVNASAWRSVENAIRALARGSDRVYVFTGTLFEGDEAVIGAGRVAVPSHTYKAVLAFHGSTKSMVAFIVPNQDHVQGTAGRFRVTVDEVEQRSRLNFFSELNDAEESDLESD